MATGMETWLPSLVSAGALGMLWFTFRKSTSDVDKKMDAIKKIQDGRFDVFLTKDSHKLECKISTLEIREHVSSEIETLSKTLTGHMDQIITEIKNGNGK